MSRGPGAVEGRLREIFGNNPTGVFSTGALCRRVYRVQTVQKKHRVAVLRALKRLALRSMPTLWRRAQKHDREDVWFDHRAFPSRAKDGAPAVDNRPHKW
jgi:hypothetical protein